MNIYIVLNINFIYVGYCGYVKLKPSPYGDNAVIKPSLSGLYWRNLMSPVMTRVGTVRQWVMISCHDIEP